MELRWQTLIARIKSSKGYITMNKSPDALAIIIFLFGLGTLVTATAQALN